MVAIGTGSRVVLISTGTGDRDSCDVLEAFLSVCENGPEVKDAEDSPDSDVDSDNEVKPQASPENSEKHGKSASVMVPINSFTLVGLDRG